MVAFYFRGLLFCLDNKSFFLTGYLLFSNVLPMLTMFFKLESLLLCFQFLWLPCPFLQQSWQVVILDFSAFLAVQLN